MKLIGQIAAGIVLAYLVMIPVQIVLNVVALYLIQR